MLKYPLSFKMDFGSGQGKGVGLARRFKQILHKVFFFLDVAIEDPVTWTPSPIGNFTMKSAWNAIRHTYVSQEWCKVVWFSKYVPRWAFILCLAMQ